MDTGIDGQRPVKGAWRIPVDWADVWIVLLVLLVLGWYGLSIGQLRLSTGTGVALDDGWIHLTFARNLAERGIWSINPTGQTGGASSILWVLLLAPGFWLTTNGPMISFVINGALLILLSLLVSRFWGQFIEATWARVLLTFLVVANGNMVWFVFSGMEVLLVLVLGVGTIYFASRGNLRAAMLLALLSALARPEGVLVGLAVFLWSRNRMGMKALLAGMVGLLATMMWNHHITGTLLPSTVMGRRWLIGAPPYADLNPWHVVKNLARLIGVWGYRFIQFDLSKEWLDNLGANGMFGLFAFLGAVYCALGAGIYALRMNRMMGSLAVWLGLQVAAYAIVLPTRGHAGRYQPVMLLMLLIWLALGMLIVWLRSKGRTQLRLAMVVFTLIPLSSLWTWNVVLRKSLVHFDRVHVASARWIADNTPRDAKVAAFDIGAMAYFGGRTVVDLGGLIDPAAGRALYEKEIAAYMQSNGSRYLAMVFPYTDPEVYFRDFEFDRLQREGVLRLEKEFAVPVTEPYWPGEAARVMANRMRVYSVEWNEQKQK